MKKEGKELETNWSQKWINVKEYFIFKRRRRISRPYTLLIFGIAFLLFPIINYIGIIYSHNLKLGDFLLAAKNLKTIEMILVIFSIFVGVGILLVKKWGFWLFHFYAILLISYNLKVIIKNPSLYNINALAQTILAFSAMLYFLQKDISAPYLKNYPRGWRFQKRKPVEIEIEIENQKFITRDISLGGFYVDYPNCKLVAEQEVTTRIIQNNIELVLKAGVVRIDENGAGFAFRELSKQDKNLLEQICEK